MLTRVSHPRIQRLKIPLDSFWIAHQIPLLVEVVVRTTELHTGANSGTLLTILTPPEGYSEIMGQPTAWRKAAYVRVDWSGKAVKEGLLIV